MVGCRFRMLEREFFVGGSAANGGVVVGLLDAAFSIVWWQRIFVWNETIPNAETGLENARWSLGWSFQ